MPRPRLGAINILTTADVPLVTTAETVVATVSNINTQSADERVAISGSVSVFLGTAGNSAVVRVRRGIDTTGTLVGETVTDSYAAGQLMNIPFDVSDVPGEVAGQSYVVTVTQGAATGNGNVPVSDVQVLIGT